MKKFVRSKIKGVLDGSGSEMQEPKGVVIGPDMPSSFVVGTEIDALKKQMEAVISENIKLKSSVHRLSDDNLYLHDQLEKVKSGKQTKPFDRTVSHVPDEIGESIRRVLDENDDLAKRLEAERKQTKIITANYESEIDRITKTLEEALNDKAKLERNLENCLLDMDNLRTTVEVFKNENEQKSSYEEFRSKYETAKLLLEDLQKKYEEEVKVLSDDLLTCQMEKKQLAVKFVEMRSKLMDGQGQIENLQAKLTRNENANQKLNESLLEYQNRLHQLEFTLDDLLELSKEVVVQKSFNEQGEELQHVALKNRMKNFESKCHKLQIQNDRLKKFKIDAEVSLMRAKQYLEDESSN